MACDANKRLISLVETMVKDGEMRGHRRAIFICDERTQCYRYAQEIVNHLKDKLPRIVQFSRHAPTNILGAENVLLKDVQQYLGQTYDIVIADFHNSLVPNDFGAVSGMVRGGGLYIFLTPPLSEWPMAENFFHEFLAAPPYTINHVKHNFLKRLIAKIKTHPGIAIFEGGEIVQVPRPYSYLDERMDLIIPTRTLFAKNLYELCLTMDQINVLSDMEKLCRKGKGIYILTADRGRGKSSILGIGIVGLCSKLKKSNLRVLITAPQKSAVTEVFRFIKRGIDALPREIEIKHVYAPPKEACRQKADIIVVDEAASIPVSILFAFTKVGKIVIYSSTTHGYEGTGRTFKLRFIHGLKGMGYNIMQRDISEPIRYDPGDPIESWCFDTLLLDAEPPEIKDVSTDNIVYKAIDINDMLDNETLLREYYGIFVLAHYRNNPNDLGILLDAPNHYIRYAECNGHCVCSLQIAKEGNLPQEVIDDMYYGSALPGNLVPDRVIKFHRIKEFGKLVGYRIVRIATHPKHMSKGIGSFMLNKLSEEDVDWLGTSFGATEDLLRFWKRNGFFTIYVSPLPNESTGEYSITMIRPLSTKAKEIIETIRKRFISRFIDMMGEVYKDMDPYLAAMILDTSTLGNGKITTDMMDPVSWDDLLSYAYGPATYESENDVVFGFFKSLYVKDVAEKMSLKQRAMIVAKVFQCRSRNFVSKLVGMGPTQIIIELREIVRKYLEDLGVFSSKIKEFRKRYKNRKD